MKFSISFLETQKGYCQFYFNYFRNLSFYLQLKGNLLLFLSVKFDSLPQDITRTMAT